MHCVICKAGIDTPGMAMYDYRIWQKSYADFCDDCGCRIIEYIESLGGGMNKLKPVITTPGD